MAVEIERKFLVEYLPESELPPPSELTQGYVLREKEQVVRIRISDNSAFLTLKKACSGIERKEFEYPVPLDDAHEMLKLFCADTVIRKKRYHIEHQGFIWVIDQFSGDNKGLVIAEIELDDECQAFDVPDWAGIEVTGDPKYYNSNLISYPYREWKKKS